MEYRAVVVCVRIPAPARVALRVAESGIVFGRNKAEMSLVAVGVRWWDVLVVAVVVVTRV